MNESTDHFRSALKVNEGVDQPGPVNLDAVAKFARRKKKFLEPDEYFQGIITGNITLLSQAITLVESSLPQHQEVAQKVLELSLPHSGNSTRLGITGVPGVGKSTFIEAFGKHLTSIGHKLAVLAIDPSSTRSKGSILGDKTRMEDLSADPNAFIRPSPSAGSLGGVARKTRETIVLCEAAGFDVILIETVGVGQSETAVHSMVDFFLLLMLAGAGDELQGIKRGIMEMADAIIINKADGDNLQKAMVAMAEYQNAIHLFAPAPSGWNPVVEKCSAKLNNNIDKIWQIVENYLELTKKSGYFYTRRKDQMNNYLFQAIDQGLKDAFYHNPEIQKKMHELQVKIGKGKLSPFIAAQHLLHAYFEGLKSPGSRSQ